MAHTPTKTITEAMAAAKARGHVREIRGYCDNNGGKQHPCCPARQVTVVVKDYDDVLVGLIRANGLRCPVCATPLLWDWALTDAEMNARDDRDARCAVAVQMYARDHAHGFVTADVIMDDRLPPTPPDWWRELRGETPPQET